MEDDSLLGGVFDIDVVVADRVVAAREIRAIPHAYLARACLLQQSHSHKLRRTGNSGALFVPMLFICSLS